MIYIVFVADNLSVITEQWMQVEIKEKEVIFLV